MKIFSAALAIVFAICCLPFHPVSASKSKLDEGTSDQGSWEYDPSLQLPYSVDGTPVRDRASRHTLDDDFSTVRVLMNFETNISVTSMTLTLYGAYYIDQNLRPLVGSESQGFSVTLTASSGVVTVRSGGSILYQGNQVDINRVVLGVNGGYAHLVTSPATLCSGKDYLGNFRFTASGSALRLVSHVPTAHYLYGVVPFEMNCTWEMEALKCQAIVSKSYAFGYPYAGEDYDITANRAHQYYRGYDPTRIRAMAACISVAGEILFYQGTVGLAFFGATNGGETNLPSYEWGGSSVNGAYSIARDPYDRLLTHEYMALYEEELEIHYWQPVENAHFRRLIDDEVTAALGHSAELVCVINAEVNTRKFPDTELNLTKLDLTVRVIDNGDPVNVSLRFDVDKLKSDEYPVLVPSGGRTYRIFYGYEIPGGYTIRHCRYGHGIGLSQHGAVARAADGHSRRSILQYYLPGMSLETVRESNPELPYSYTKPIAAYGSTTAASTRLRSGPSTDYAILDTLPAGAHVDIITAMNGWLVCIANNKLGYIRGDLVNIAFFPSPSGGERPIGAASVRQGVLDAQLRFGPSHYSAPMLTLYPGVTVEVWHAIGDWYHVRFAGRYAYMHSSKLTQPSWNYAKLLPVTRDASPAQ